MDAAMRDLCGRDVALLGENDSHGDGRAIGFKAVLVRRLVERCHFNAVFFEASHYDFLEISRRLRRGEPVSPEMVSSAIGWLWNHDEEVASLIPFLWSEAKSGRVTLGGLDDQLGARDAFYSIEQMPAELTGFLPSERRPDCRELFRRRILFDYPASEPHTPATNARLQACLAEIGTAVRAQPGMDAPTRTETLQMIASAERCIARDFDKPEQNAPGRDLSMHRNLQWLAARLAPHSKIIIWAQNVHIARDASASPSFAGGRNLGAYVHAAYGKRAFALGFSAVSGSVRYARHENRPVPAAPAGSLEFRAFPTPDGEAVYLGPRRLSAYGLIPGGVFNHRYVPARWAQVMDGVVVFRAERPPKRSDD